MIGLNTTEDEAQVDAGKMSYHVVEVKAMHENFDHEITALGMTLKNMKFNVGENLWKENERIYERICDIETGEDSNFNVK